jgi:hypothetical protein
MYRGLLSCSHATIGDHSLEHNRTFHYRNVVGFHSDAAPLMSGSERLGLEPGDPVCAYGGELTRRRFVPDRAAVDLCRRAAREAGAPAGSAAWSDALAARLIASGLGFRRFGRLCIAGTYEADEAFATRLATYLTRGRDRLTEFTGSVPAAFAYPWWQPSRVADACLRRLGYRVTFSGRGLCRLRSTFDIPRLFVNNATPRPLDPLACAAARSSRLTGRVGDLARRVAFA